MTKEDKGKKKYSQRRRYQHTFIKKRIEHEEPVGNDNMQMPVSKKQKT